MFKVLAVAAAFFVVFAAGGYSVGRSVVTSEPHMLATIANASSLKLSTGHLLLELSDPHAKPYWTLDLSTNRPAFQNADAVLRSFDGKTLPAEGNLLLTFASGGAATTTVATIYKEIRETHKSGDWRTFAAMLAGGTSGYLVGYYAAIKMAKPSDKEIQLALRNPDTVEKVKKYVFLSLFKEHGLNFELTEREKTSIESACNSTKDPSEFVECVRDRWSQSGYDDRTVYLRKLIASAQSALSNDKVNLKGEEFLVFVLQ